MFPLFTAGTFFLAKAELPAELNYDVLSYRLWECVVTFYG